MMDDGGGGGGGDDGGGGGYVISDLIENLSTIYLIQMRVPNQDDQCRENLAGTTASGRPIAGHHLLGHVTCLFPQTK